MRTRRATGKNLCNVKNVLMMSLNQNLNKYPKMKREDPAKTKCVEIGGIGLSFLFLYVLL